VFGFLNIDKPQWVTSRDAVDRVKWAVRPHKVGHAGTLDPLATGVLVVCVGQATRLAEQVQRHPKAYDATFLLGRVSDTEDTEGEVMELLDAPLVDRLQLAAVLPQFIGRIPQVPPAYSAVKVDGRRAYKLARRGQAVQLEARPVDIHQLEIVEFEYPRVRLRIVCGSGTYIRSLGRDLARAVGTEAVMTSLRRDWIGPFHVESALPMDAIHRDTIAQHLQSPLTALAPCRRRILTPDEETHTRNGRYIPRGQIGEPLSWQATESPSSTSEGNSSDFARLAVDHETIAAVNGSGELVAILRERGDDQLGPSLVFPVHESTN
jgi:tRNA pseudouridine55 synthase